MFSPHLDAENLLDLKRVYQAVNKESAEEELVKFDNK